MDQLLHRNMKVSWRSVLLAIISISALFFSAAMLSQQFISLAALASTVRTDVFPEASMPIISSTTTVPQYFQTSPELWAGPTATGKAPFLAQTNPVFFEPTASFTPNSPLETSIPIVGAQSDQNVFQLMGHLSPYFPNPDGFGVDEYPLPPGARISQVQMLSRHGARYPTSENSVATFGKKISKLKGKFTAKGQLAFLNDWKYELGVAVLVPRGRQELFNSGVLHYYQYGQLYNPNSKIIVRTTTQDRMLKSAENFLAGFFGLEWTQNATIEVIIEAQGYNNSLAGYDNCKNSHSFRSAGGSNASHSWKEIYLQDATKRLNLMLDGMEWNIMDTYAAQSLCPYETVAYGYSSFCQLFTFEEWKGFEYSIDLFFAGSSSFQSPTARAVGIGYVQESIARLQNHTLGYSGSQINVTLDNNTETFPLNQSLYFDFSHDTNIMSILTAFGFKQFNALLPVDHHPGPHNLTVSRMEPFGARLDIEIIKTPYPLNSQRIYEKSPNETTYLHFMLNQRTLPLGLSFPECGPDRLDGWCELDTFLSVQKNATQLARYDYACNGDYDAAPWGEITDGSPIG
ncbi:hypothetical protein Golomagni_03117 [Golovinomyces magnicellulatus]|nr:hypothetical protein Golomagni_03117 [Golovinomyces magnicellulatus]